MGHADRNAIIMALIAIFGGAGVWTFWDHNQQRNADKEIQDNEVLKEIRSIHQEIDEVKQTIASDKAESRRVRILRFADEVFMDVKHSKDSFDQVLSDITGYETYCMEHPEFKNDQTAETINYLKDIYRERMEKKDFAHYGKRGMVL